MGWSDRNRSSLIKEDIMALMQTGSTGVWFRGRNMDAVSEPSAFKEMYGVGVHKEFVLSTADDIPRLRSWLSTCNDLVVGYFSYDLKNHLEALTSNDQDPIGFSMAYFFIPETVVKVDPAGQVETLSHSERIKIPTAKKDFFKSDLENPLMISKSDYIASVNSLKDHIQLGDVYEVNYCVENTFQNASIDPLETFLKLQESSPAPFSCYLADKGKYVLSSSPERFIKKVGNRLISQPMKGTNRKMLDNEEQKLRLKSDPKEISENVMITDLVRNDLSKSAKPNTVKVDELCGVYEFEHVNQMISTVSCEMRDDMHPLDVILNAFPMGSMTGAPKIRAMELIEEHENFSRGLYSGAIGYFTPELDFDFNVVIRSILYNEEKKVVTFPTGGAITINSDPEAEYDECILKAEAMRKVLMGHGK